jgi:translation initiation factor 1
MNDSLKDALEKLKKQGLSSSLKEPARQDVVYSTNPAPAPPASPEANTKVPKFVAVLRIEKQGRGGKTVTVIDGLPKNELFLKDLTTRLKKQCGTGGTYAMDGRDGLIEIQGDKREQVRMLLLKSGIRSKG